MKTRVRFRARSILQISTTKVVRNRIYGLQKCSAKARSTARAAFSHSLGRFFPLTVCFRALGSLQVDEAGSRFGAGEVGRRGSGRRCRRKIGHERPLALTWITRDPAPVRLNLYLDKTRYGPR